MSAALTTEHLRVDLTPNGEVELEVKYQMRRFAGQVECTPIPLTLDEQEKLADFLLNNLTRRLP